MIATNLVGSIQLIRAALPHLRAQGGGRIIQISSYGGQAAFPGNSLSHATKWGIEGFAESVAQEVAPFHRGDDRRAGRRPHRVSLRQRPSRQPHAGLRRHPGAQLPGHARPGQRPRPRRPRPHGPRASSTASTPSPHRCAWSSARRRWRARSRPCASASPTSRRRPSSPPPRTSRPASETAARRGAGRGRSAASPSRCRASRDDVRRARTARSPRIAKPRS